jgi:hypothetical protein
MEMEQGARTDQRLFVWPGLLRKGCMQVSSCRQQLISSKGVAGGGWGIRNGYETTKRAPFLESVGCTTLNTIIGFSGGAMAVIFLPIAIPIGLGIGIMRSMNHKPAV